MNDDIALKKPVLLASRAIESDKTEGGFVLLSDIASACRQNEASLPVVLWLLGRDPDDHVISVYSDIGWKGRQRLEFIYGLFRYQQRFKLIHTAHAPTFFNAFIFKILKKTGRKHGIKYIQTITALPEVEDNKLKQLCWGDCIICLSNKDKKRLNKANIPAIKIAPWPSPDRVCFNSERRVKTRQQLFSGFDKVVLFPGEFSRLGIDRNFADCVKETLIHNVSTCFVLACRSDFDEVGEDILAEIPESLRSQVKLLGEDNRIIELLEASDLVVFPAVKMSGKFHPPLVLMEALTLGTPILVSDLVDINLGSNQSAVRQVSINNWRIFGQDIKLSLNNTSRYSNDSNQSFKDMVTSYIHQYYLITDDSPNTQLVVERANITNKLFCSLKKSGITWALQGDKEALNRWINTGDLTKDLDLWVPSRERGKIQQLVKELGGITIASSTSEQWLQHDIYLFPIAEQFGLIDFTYGDLRVGPLSLCDEQDVIIQINSGIPRLDRSALISDLVIRPMLRGRMPEKDRLNEAFQSWHRMEQKEKNKWLSIAISSLGPRISLQLKNNLDSGVGLDKNMLKLMRRCLIKTSFSTWPRLRSLIKHRHSIIRSPFNSYPLGRKTKGLIIALVGTDGAGKSTLAWQLTNQLSQYGYQTKTPYFGRARGNLPGINWIREKLELKFKEKKRSTSQGKYSEKLGRHEKKLKWLGSWYYAFEYVIRSILWAYIPRLKGKIVILDRYVYDLRIMPGASKAAIRIAERLSVKPDLLVFLHAPEKEILARKPERDLQTLKAHQATYQELIDTLEGSFWVGRVSTSEKSSAQPSEILIPKILTASHRLHIDTPLKSQSILEDE